tara:strand:+ start:180 stop:767 length:588 start_codon:yes stop_codon:yes gene_type:complete
MPKFDPMEYQNEKSPKSYEDRPKKITAGKKVCVPVGAKFKIKNGKNVLEIGYVIIKDLEKKGEEGLMFIDQFYLTPNALFMLSNFVVAMGYRKPFDYEDMDDIYKIMLLGPFEGVFEDNYYNGKTYPKIKYYNTTPIERAEDNEPCFSDKELKIINAGESSWDKLLKYRMDDAEQRYGTYVDKFEPIGPEEEIPF